MCIQVSPAETQSFNSLNWQKQMMDNNNEDRWHRSLYRIVSLYSKRIFMDCFDLTLLHITVPLQTALFGNN